MKGEGGGMAQESLLQMLEELAIKAKSFERERIEAVAKMQALERETEQLKELIALAESKVGEMLNADSHQDMPTGQAARRATIPSLRSEEMQEVEKRFPRAFTPD
jgi:FtsZ-binding cell division protein ZapB